MNVAFQKIGILSIGEMGFHWAKLLKSHGVEVSPQRREDSNGSHLRRRGRHVLFLPCVRFDSLLYC